MNAASKQTKSGRPKRRGRVARLVRAAVLLTLMALLLPYLLAPLYRYVNPVSTLMVWRWLTGARVERSYLPIERMARPLPLTVIVAEDAKYCTHSGIDWHEIRAALEEADDISAARGASTITQQTAKNLFLWQGRSLVRKALELPLALWLDVVLSKQRLMEIYLNVVEWGPNGEFGAEAASRRVFGKSAATLTANQAAMLAAILPNPVRRNAREPLPALRRLAGTYAARAAASPNLDACVRAGKAS